MLYTFSGVRPLPYVPDAAESSVPRSHVLHDHGDTGLPGLVTVVGGKLTTYRQLAEDAVDDAYRRLGRKAPRCPTRNRRFIGAQVLDRDALSQSLRARSGRSEQQVNRLLALYGSRAAQVLRLAEQNPTLGEVIDPTTGLLAAELVFAVQVDLAQTLTDVLARRVLVAFEPGHGLSFLDRAVAVLADHLGWDDDRVEEEIAEYHRWLEVLAVPDPSGPRSESFGASAPATAGQSG